jgi:shikimate dehydrogenase
VTRRVALIGRPLRRRHSSVMHDAAFAAAGIDARYELRELEAHELPAFVAAARSPAWLGFQITAPYKQAVVPLLDGVEDAAQQIGAVNSVERTGDGRLVGFNTDAPGFAAAVRQDLGLDLAGARVVVIGAGGAARAVVAACRAAGVAGLLVANRTAATAAALAATAGGEGAVGCGLDDPRVAAALARADLLVNATSVGMLAPGAPVSVDLLPPGAAVFDLVYAPPVTPLLAAARARGLRVANGAGMLVAQAAIAWARWTGAGDPTTVMADAVRPLLDGGTAA